MKFKFWCTGAFALMLAACGGGGEKKDIGSLSHGSDEKKAIGSVSGRDGIAVANGHLVFRNQAHFDATAQILLGQSVAQRDAWLRNLPNFKP